jgi:hypothetical protein
MNGCSGQTASAQSLPCLRAARVDELARGALADRADAPAAHAIRSGVVRGAAGDVHLEARHRDRHAQVVVGVVELRDGPLGVDADLEFVVPGGTSVTSIHWQSRPEP